MWLEWIEGAANKKVIHHSSKSIIDLISNEANTFQLSQYKIIQKNRKIIVNCITDLGM